MRTGVRFGDIPEKIVRSLMTVNVAKEELKHQKPITRFKDASHKYYSQPTSHESKQIKRNDEQSPCHGNSFN
jgi:hypothetical protein